LVRFGTDGIRGAAGTELTAELARRLGWAAGQVLGGPEFLVGRDTRQSGPWLLAALAEGLASAGVGVIDLGVLPTPGVADLARDRGAPAAVVSASHNPYSDNGVKLLSAGGRKLTGEEERRIEAALEAAPAGVEAGGRGGAGGDGVGGVWRGAPAALERYCSAVGRALEGRDLGGLPVVIDCANGAAWQSAPAIIAGAGAQLVEILNADPDGTNINRSCGSTDPSDLAAAVVRHRAAAGLALDGDADRVLAVDDQGGVVDGDRLLALFATDLAARGLLVGNGVAVTAMTNLGFHHAMARAGIEVVTTPVGDRHIVEVLEERGWTLGGEQSGHVVFRQLWPHLAPTGDGTLTGMLLLDLLVRRRQPLSPLAAAAMEAVPQVLRNVEVANPAGLEGAASVWDEVSEVERALGDQGRVLLRRSGTEPVVRVMVEAVSASVAAAVADRLSRALVRDLGPA
jgi:phosphoglucosamine mutase